MPDGNGEALVQSAIPPCCADCLGGLLGSRRTGERRQQGAIKSSDPGYRCADSLKADKPLGLPHVNSGIVETAIVAGAEASSAGGVASTSAEDCSLSAQPNDNTDYPGECIGAFTESSSQAEVANSGIGGVEPGVQPLSFFCHSSAANAVCAFHTNGVEQSGVVDAVCGLSDTDARISDSSTSGAPRICIDAPSVTSSSDVVAVADRAVEVNVSLCEHAEPLADSGLASGDAVVRLKSSSHVNHLRDAELLESIPSGCHADIRQSESASTFDHGHGLKALPTVVSGSVASAADSAGDTAFGSCEGSDIATSVVSCGTRADRLTRSTIGVTAVPVANSDFLGTTVSVVQLDGDRRNEVNAKFSDGNYRTDSDAMAFSLTNVSEHSASAAVGPASTADVVEIAVLPVQSQVCVAAGLVAMEAADPPEICAAVGDIVCQSTASAAACECGYDEMSISFCALQGRVDAVKALVFANAAVDERDVHLGRTPLMWAAQHGQKEVVRFLLECEADVHQRDSAGCSSLLLSAEGGWAGVVRLLLESTACPDDRNQCDLTALMHAATEGDIEVLDVLLDGGADIEAQDGVFGRSSLMWAVLAEHGDVVARLLERGARVDRRDADGRTAAMLAAESGSCKAAQLLARMSAVAPE